MSTPILIFVFKLLAAFAGLTLIYLALIRRRTSYRTARIYLLAMPLMALACALVTVKVLPPQDVVTDQEFVAGATDLGDAQQVPFREKEQAQEGATNEPMAENAGIPQATVPVPVAEKDAGRQIAAQEMAVAAGNDPDTQAAPTADIEQPSGEIVQQAAASADRGDAAGTATVVAGRDTAWAWDRLLIWIYAAGVGLALCWLAAQTLYILYVRRMATPKIVDGTPVYRSGYVKTPFSFGKDIYIDREMAGERLSVVISHERAHIAHRHYIDKTICCLWTAAMWCNPFMWFIVRELCMLHEFEADGDVLRRGVPRKLYVHCLVEEVMGAGPYIVNGFSQTLIKNRLIMIKKGTQIRSGRFRVVLAVPLIVAMAASMTLARAEAEPPPVLDPVADRAAQAAPVVDAAAVDMVAEVEPAGMEEGETTVQESEDLTEDSAETDAADAKDEPLLKADVMPRFQGGDLNDFRNWVMSKVVYPVEAQKNKIQGKVLVTFVVGKNGKVGDVAILNSPHTLLSEAVARVIIQSPAWTPGMQRGKKKVRVKYTIPVDFILNNDAAAPSADESFDKEPLQMADKMPVFNGGTVRDFAAWVMQSVVYPAEAHKDKVQGKVIASFVVEADGSVGNIVIRSSPDESLSKEVTRVLSQSPRWTPGEQDGRKVPVMYTVPVDFHLEDSIEPDMTKLSGQAVTGDSRGVFVDSQHEYILPKSKTTVLVSNYSPREYRVYGYRILDIECRADETRVLIAIDMPADKPAWWLIFGSGIYIRDTQTKDKYMIRRVDNDIPMDKVIVVQGCGGQSVAFTAIFPPLKKTVKVIDVVDMPNTKIPLPMAGGGSPSGVVWRNVMLSRFPGGDPTVPGEVIK